MIGYKMTAADSMWAPLYTKIKAKLKGADQLAVTGAFRKVRINDMATNKKNPDPEKLSMLKSRLEAFGVRMPCDEAINTVQSSQNVKIQLGMQGQSSRDASGQVSDGVEPKEDKEETLKASPSAKEEEEEEEEEAEEEEEDEADGPSQQVGSSQQTEPKPSPFGQRQTVTITPDK